MPQTAYSIGVDYGTNSVRAVLVDTANGREMVASVYDYPTGRKGIILDESDPSLARQNPADYFRGFNRTVAFVISEAKAKIKGFSPDQVAGIGIDTTGSTPIPVDAKNRALSLTDEFSGHPAAQAWLWKDHTSHQEAAEITALAVEMGEPYLAKCGGTYSSEWFWAKILHCLRTAPEVFSAAESWVEACDFIPAVLCGITDPARIRRSICAAGHKAMYGEEWNGLPSREFLSRLAPELGDLRHRLYEKAYTADQTAGKLCPDVAGQVDLPAGIPVAVGAFDAHFGAVGAGIKPGRLVKIIGTSTCDLMLAPASLKRDIPGICGMVPGSVLPGTTAIEAGQSAVGDLLLWFVEHLCPEKYTRHGNVFDNIESEAAKLLPGESGLLALDWNNGNRTVLVNPRLSGLLIGQTLHTTAPEVLRALIEATAFGARAIIRRLDEYGVPVREIVACGGLAEKDPLMMQILADVCQCPIKISRSAQACALGGAIFGSVVGGIHSTVDAAQKVMTGTKNRVYSPEHGAVPVYQELFDMYMELHDEFGGVRSAADLPTLMGRLLDLRDRVRDAKRAV